MPNHIQTQEEWETEMAERALELARGELYLELRFMGAALGALAYRPDRRLQTLATDGETLFFAAGQVLRVFRQNMRFLDRAYLHTVLHCVFSHLWIAPEGAEQPGENREAWSVACDIAVEYVIDGMGKQCTRRILSWTRQQVYEKLGALQEGVSAAVIYRELKRLDREELARLWKEFYTDDHSFWPKRGNSRAKRQEALAAQKKWDKLARQTRMEQEMRGDGAAEGTEFLLSQLAARGRRRSYREFLQRFAVWREELHADPEEFDLGYYAYGLRLYGNLPLVEPLESREAKRIREFVIAIDTSYSTSGELVQNFLRETVDILSQSESFFVDAVIHILQCDNRVQDDAVIRSSGELDAFLSGFCLRGGGGTDFRPAFAYVNERVERGEFQNLAGLLYFTDGKGIYPKKRPVYRSAFLFLEDYDETAVPPWAMRLKLEAEELEQYAERSGQR